MFRDASQRRQDLQDALSGVDLTEEDGRLLTWLAEWPQETTTSLADLIARSRTASATNGAGGDGETHG